MFFPCLPAGTAVSGFPSAFSGLFIRLLTDAMLYPFAIDLSPFTLNLSPFTKNQNYPDRDQIFPRGSGCGPASRGIIKAQP